MQNKIRGCDFIAKLAIIEQKADETLFWLKIIKEMKILDISAIESIIVERNEIIAIIVSSIKTARLHNAKTPGNPKFKIQNSK